MKSVIWSCYNRESTGCDCKWVYWDSRWERVRCGLYSMQYTKQCVCFCGLYVVGGWVEGVGLGSVGLGLADGASLESSFFSSD